MRKYLFAAAFGLSALAATPAMAQAYQAPPPPPEGYYDDGYNGPDEWAQAEEGDRVGNGYQQDDAEPVVEQGYQQQAYSDRGGARRYRPGDYYEGGGAPLAGDPRDGRRYRPRRCTGTTGAILGGIAGALIGGDIGGGRRGYGRYRRGGGAGTIVGAGVGAVVGSEIDRSTCEDRNYRR